MSIDDGQVRTTTRTDRGGPGRIGYPAALREEAASLRREGVGRTDIARQLGVGVSTVARWFREDGVPAPRVEEGATVGRRQLALISYQRTVRERWAHQQAEQDAHRDAVGALTDRELLLVGVALYWAEGSKSKPWRRAHDVVLVNSDPTIIRTFIRFLTLLEVPRRDIRARVSIHETADVSAGEAFWRNVVGSDIAFQPSTLKRHKPGSVRHNTDDTYQGCLALRVSRGAALYRRIVGTWEGMTEALLADDRSPVV